MKTTKLFYVFKVDAKGCDRSKPEYWITRHQSEVSNETKETTIAIAGRLACKYLTVTETGIRVTFLGLKNGSGEITPMNPFTMTVLRSV